MKGIEVHVQGPLEWKWPEDSRDSWPVGCERGLERRLEATGQAAGRGRVALGRAPSGARPQGMCWGSGLCGLPQGPRPQLPHLGNGEMNAPPEAHSRASPARLCAQCLLLDPSEARGGDQGKAGSGAGGCCTGGFGAFL